MTDLVASARSLFVAGKGLLAADESVETATKRLAAHGIAAGPKMREQYRDLFLSTLGIEKYLSGVILFSESLGQKGSGKKRFPEVLLERGIAPGVKVDLGTEPFGEGGAEFITNGLIGLSDRLLELREQGAVFTKWRAVYRILGDTLPSPSALHENAKRLAGYAKEVQAAGLVPILEPDILSDGKHGRTRSRAVIGEVLKTLFSVLDELSVDRASLVLKTSMALSGKDSGKRDTPEEVAGDTLGVLMENVPKQVAGILFLSGGQSPVEATRNLAAISRRAKEVNAPWPLTFSFARALQEEALVLWKGKEENIGEAQAVFLARLAAVSAAQTS